MSWGSDFFLDTNTSIDHSQDFIYEYLRMSSIVSSLGQKYGPLGHSTFNFPEMIFGGQTKI